MWWFALAFALELGVVPLDTAVMYTPPSRVYEQPGFYQQFEVETLLFRHLALQGKVSIYEWQFQDHLSFFPYRCGFEAGAELCFEPLRIGWRHYCTHPIATSFPDLAYKLRWEGAYDEIYLRLEGRIR